MGSNLAKDRIAFLETKLDPPCTHPDLILGIIRLISPFPRGGIWTSDILQNSVDPHESATKRHLDLVGRTHRNIDHATCDKCRKGPHLRTGYERCGSKVHIDSRICRVEPPQGPKSHSTQDGSLLDVSSNYSIPAILQRLNLTRYLMHYINRQGSSY